MNKTLCSAFWNHTNIRGGDRVFPCCRFKQPIQTFDGNVAAVLHSAEYDRLRQDSITGVYNPNCEKCYYEEQNGKESLRERFNKEYTIDQVELKYLEIGFDNICNLACDGCWEEWSSTWANIKSPSTKKINILTTKEFINIPDTLNKVLFLGGEPLMTSRHNRFLKKLNSPEAISVIYYTNGTFLFSDDDLELLNKFKHVVVYVSIDGIGELNDSVRKGSKWSEILTFLEQLKNTKFEIKINSVIHRNNWMGIKELSDFIKQNNYVWTTNLLTYPTKLDIINLMPREKQEFECMLNEEKIPNADYILKHLCQEKINLDTEQLVSESKT
jgi:sulfatase maturation enzyme AslB (radical SAM superfamily)